ncbi:Phenolic acid decarboxylase (PAD) [Lentzea xinjiangensis]|uniref:Phenolic acid decarboxylase (PAD) n=1 Tax=Lentzea xinjiangensis TaxID=402600 RepID=A0A1H9NKA3_9PSEU|nr:phenolic acid decarboxylase [Lentzea xinjiangensis]SER36390.1 Phenolic acid decarboxylase (PAD) [Lentzea xinjiangensis]
MNDALLGKHLIYTYDAGWRYELYVKNATSIDYRIHSGPVGGRWVKDQPVHTARLDSWAHTCPGPNPPARRSPWSSTWSTAGSTA